MLHDLARIDRHRAPLLHAGLVLPKYASGNILEWRGDRKSWVTTEYETGAVNEVVYEVRVVVAEPIRGAENHAVAPLLGSLIRLVDWLVEALHRGVLLDLTGNGNSD
jgi:hypothetical protein